MRTFLPWYELRAVRSLDECLRTLTDEPGVWRPFAGGTDLMVLMEAGKLPRTHYLSIWGLSGLRGITVSSDAVALGALTTYADVLAHPSSVGFPPLPRGADRRCRDQNRGHDRRQYRQRVPAAGHAAGASSDAELELVSAGGVRRILPSLHICQGDGPASRGYQLDSSAAGARRLDQTAAWLQRRAQAISKVCSAAAASLRRRHRRHPDAFGSVAPTVPAARRDLLRTAASTRSWSTPLRCHPPRYRSSRTRSTAAYRRRVAQNLVAEFLTALVSQ